MSKHLRPLTPSEQTALAEFQRSMREEVIPLIVQDIYEREILAQVSRRRLLTSPNG